MVAIMQQSNFIRAPYNYTGAAVFLVLEESK